MWQQRILLKHSSCKEAQLPPSSAEEPSHVLPQRRRAMPGQSQCSLCLARLDVKTLNPGWLPSFSLSLQQPLHLPAHQSLPGLEIQVASQVDALPESQVRTRARRKGQRGAEFDGTWPAEVRAGVPASYYHPLLKGFRKAHAPERTWDLPFLYELT